LVRRSTLFDEEGQASDQAATDLSVTASPDPATLALSLRELGYVSVDDFRLINGSGG
jgi:hypothetical protein